MRHWRTLDVLTSSGESWRGSLVVKRSIILRGHKTSISVEEPFWKTLKDIAASRRVTRSQLITDIDAQRTAGNLSSAVRLFVLNQYYQTPSTKAQATGYQTSGHH